MKVLYFDTETTGLDPKVNEIVQFSALIESNGMLLDEINVFMQPTRWDHVDQAALDVTGKTIEDLKGYGTPAEGFRLITNFLNANVDKYDKSDKYYPAGHNVTFDLDFFQAFWKQHGDQYGIGSYINWRSLDSRVLANFLTFKGKLDLPDVKLVTLCNHYGIELDAHDALNDVKATRELIKLMMEII